MHSRGAHAAAGGRRVWLFRFLAVLLGPLCFLLSVEGILRLVGFGYPASFFLSRDEGGQSVLTTNPEFGKRFFPPGLARPPRPLTLRSAKPAGTLRVFVFGESAAMGDPDPRFGLPRMLEVLLRERYPGRTIEVVNAAVVAISSHVVLPIARECAAKEGDVWVVYMGNNEMIGPFGPITVFGWQTPPLPLIRGNLALKATRLGQGLEAVTRFMFRRGGERREWGGMTMMAEQRLSSGDPRLNRVYSHYEANLEAILAEARRAGVSVILCTVATNLRDCAPFASVHRPGLTREDSAAWEGAFRRGTEAEGRRDYRGALEAYRGAAAVDDQFAELAYRQAVCARELGRTNEVAPFLTRARDFDALQFRADGRINAIVRRTAARHADGGVQLLDAEALLSEGSPFGAAGGESFYEHVHFNPAGNYVLARAVADRIAPRLEGPAGGRSGGDWLTESDCLRRLGFTDWNRHQILVDVLSRVRSAPFTGQVYHDRDVRGLEARIEALRLATKPASIRRAAEQVARVVEAHPEEPDLRWNLAELLELDGNRNQAIQEWREVLRRIPTGLTPAFNLGRLLDAGGRGEEAAAVYRKCLEADPAYFEARYALGVTLTRLGRWSEARGEFIRAIGMKPSSVEARLAYGMGLSQAGAVAEARREFEEVLRLDPANTTAREQLGAK